jgi:SAM-dependent methyltransferase
MSTAEAIEQLRADPEYADLIHDSYLGPDTREASSRFERSGEFQETVSVLGGFEGREVLDLGAGTGIASHAIANAGAARVFALDPDPSPVVGRGAIAKLADDRIEILDGVGEAIPLPERSVDIVYGRQVLHHTRDLDAVAREANRVLRPGGTFFCCREHVVADDEELAAFLESHAVHRLAGGEYAYRLDQYVAAIERSGLRLRHVWGLYDSIINAFPVVRSGEELQHHRRQMLGWPLAAMGGAATRLPVTAGLVRRRLAPHTYPGAPYTFVAERPLR